MHLLFWLSLTPVATAWMGENNFESITVAVYAILLNLCELAYYILLRTIVAEHKHNDALLIPLQKQSRKGVISTIAYTLAIGAAFIHPAISGVLFILIAVLWWIPDRNIEKKLKEKE